MFTTKYMKTQPKQRVKRYEEGGAVASEDEISPETTAASERAKRENIEMTARQKGTTPDDAVGSAKRGSTYSSPRGYGSRGGTNEFRRGGGSTPRNG